MPNHESVTKYHKYISQRGGVEGQSLCLLNDPLGAESDEAIRAEATQRLPDRHEGHAKSLALTSLYFVTNGWFMTSISGSRSSGLSFSNCPRLHQLFSPTWHHSTGTYSDDDVSSFRRKV